MSFAAAFLLVAATVLGAVAQQPARPADSAADEAAIAQRIRTLEGELARLAAERDSVVRAFEAADVELALRREQLRNVANRAAHLADEIRAQQAEVERLSDATDATRRILALRAVSLYRVGPLSYNRLLLAADSAEDALVAYQMITYLTARDRDLMRSARAELGELRAARTRLAATRAQLAETEDEVGAQTVELERQQEARRQALQELDREAEARRVALDDAEGAARELEATLEAFRGAAAVEAPAPFAAARGLMPWPVPGEVVGGFGRQRHPIYDTFTISRGIEIAGSVGDPVGAVFGGRVAFADWYSGYGLLVILDHGSDWFTLYGHLSAIEVRVGDRVEPGALVGRVGETASLTGPNLYFEIREGTDALNPLQWLAPRDR